MSRIAFASNPELESHSPSQAAADALREAAGADMAFLAAGMVKPLASVSDLSQLLVYPTDTLSVVKLSGAQIRLALERSVSLVPLPSSAFLQISGLEVAFSKSAPVDKRITDVSVGNSKLDGSKVYTVAMPTTLARGGLGYFKVWNKDAITRTLDGTLESILKGKTNRNTSDRWTASN
ncbi:MAG: 5'-nucleotidase C-terminal domain-containing protein [Chthonomonas sp.]|nr:5'-nucleotidase C-terminal domain-containing protein [Chthonomonas sp.]